MKPVVLVRLFLWLWVAIVIAAVVHTMSTAPSEGGPGLSRVMVIVIWFVAAMFVAIGSVMAGLKLESGMSLRRAAFLPAILHLMALGFMWFGVF